MLEKSQYRMFIDFTLKRKGGGREGGDSFTTEFMFENLIKFCSNFSFDN